MAWNDDDFTGSDGSAPDSTKWKIYAGSPDIQSNALELNTTNIERVNSRGILSGDFEIQVDFAVQGTPSTNSYRAELRVYVDSTHYISIGPARYSSANYFQVAYNTGGSESYQGAARTYFSGELKLVRSGSNITPYYKDGSGGSFTALTARAIGVGSGEIQLLAVSWDNYPSVDCRFDDFIVTAGTVSTQGQGGQKTSVVSAQIEFSDPPNYSVSHIVGQVEWTQSDSKQKTSQVIGQVEWSQSDSRQKLSQIIGQVEYVDEDDLPEDSGVLPVVFIVT